MAKKKARLSPLATLMVDSYFYKTKGAERFLSYHLRFALLTEAMFGVMTAREDVEGGGPISRYTQAVREAARHLFPDEWV